MKLEDAIISHLKSNSDAIEGTYQSSDDFIVIGGIALHCHMYECGLSPIIGTHDADIVCGENSFTYLRDEYAVTPTARMSKHEYKTVLPVGDSNQQVDVDVYFTFQHDLDISDKEILDHAVVCNGVRCAHLVHLLILKVDNYLKFDGQKTSDKFKKVLHDIIQLIGLMEINETTSSLLKSNINQDRLEAVKEIANDNPEVYRTVCKLFEVQCFSQRIDHIEKCA